MEIVRAALAPSVALVALPATACISADDTIDQTVLICEPGPAATITEAPRPASLLFVTSKPGWRFGPMIAVGDEITAVLDAPGEDTLARVVRWTAAEPVPVPVAEVPFPYAVTTMTATPDALYMQAVVAGPLPNYPPVVLRVRDGEVEAVLEDRLDGSHPLLVVGDTLIAKLASRRLLHVSLVDGSSVAREPSVMRAEVTGEALLLYRWEHQVGEAVEPFDSRLIHRIDRQMLGETDTAAIASVLCLDGDPWAPLNEVDAFAIHDGAPWWNSGRSIATLDDAGARREMVRLGEDVELHGLAVRAEGVYFFAYEQAEFVLLRAPLAGDSVEALARFPRRSPGDRVKDWVVAESAIYVGLEVEGATGELWQVARS